MNCKSLKENFLKSVKKFPTSKFKSWKSPKIIIGSITLTALLIGGAIYLQVTVSATVLLVNDQQIGLVSSPEDGRKIINSILATKGEAVGQVAKTHDKIDYKTLRIKKGVFQEKQLSERELQNLVSTYIEGYELNIANETIAVLASKEELDHVLQSYQELYAMPSENNKISSIEFNESPLSKQIEVQPEEITTFDKALTLLKEGKQTKKEYIVQANDSWWLIARKNDMKTKEVLAGNPGKTEDSTLQVGQKINLVSVTPYLKVISKGVFTGTETIPFDVVSKTDFNVASGQTVVKQLGSDGSKTVTYSYIQENGQNIERKVLEETITKNPVNQIIAKGPSRASVTVAYSTSRGSGQVSGLGWPLRAGINSYYGYRWGSFHTGIDIAGDKGDPFVAAADGKVTTAGWGGGYGNMILIDHGNGVVTRYGHATKLLVSVGQHVSKGQTIGLVGSTGRSTGPHLHFEVIVNGDTVNPLNHLP